MSRIAFVNGQFVPHSSAMVAMEDRGYQFGDGVYEVVAYYYGKMLDCAAHLDRLELSLQKLAIPMPMSRRALELKIAQLLAQNTRAHGLIYIQITRGVAPRNHVYSASMKPILTMSCLPAPMPNNAAYAKGAAVILSDDIRWARCDIKSTALLANSMLRMESHHVGARETWLVRNGVITEGSATNAYMIDAKSVLRTHPANNHILGGITRDVVLSLARAENIIVDETPFTPDELMSAREAFLTSASSHIMPVTSVDGQLIGDGKVGAFTTRLMERYAAHVHAQIGRVL